MKEGFDYGAEVGATSPTLEGAELKVWPTEGEFTALIDADAIPYIVGYCSSEIEALAFKRGDHSVLARKLGHAQFLLNKWITQSDSDSAKLYITDSASNFRLGTGRAKLYKGHRASDKPPFFTEVKEWLRDFQGAKVAVGCEADDLISIEAWRRIKSLEEEGAAIGSSMAKQFSEHCVVSHDKDLMIIPHYHSNPDTGEMLWVTHLGELCPTYEEREVNEYQYWPLFSKEPVDPATCNLQQVDGILLHTLGGEVQDRWVRGAKKGLGKAKRVKVGRFLRPFISKLKGSGLMFFYAQLLMGDAADNYPGLEGCGLTKTYELLKGCTSEQELHDAVYSAYLNKYGEGEFEIQDYQGEPFLTNALDLMREQGQLAWMQTVEGERWLPIPLREALR